MLDLPKPTEIRRPVHKKLIYNKFTAELSGGRKSIFDADISRIIITNELSPMSVNMREGQQVKSIFVLQVELKKKEYNEKNIVLISKLFGQKLLIVLKYADEIQLAVYQTRLLHSEWMPAGNVNINLNGLDLDGVWEGLVMQVSGIVVCDGNSLNEQIAIEQETAKLRKQIEDLEKKARKEIQSKKKFEMFQRLKEYQKRLEGM